MEKKKTFSAPTLSNESCFATCSNKCIASSNKCLTSSNKKLVETISTKKLLVPSSMARSP